METETETETEQTPPVTELCCRRGGWYFPTPDGVSGPWATHRAAELAERGLFELARLEEISAINTGDLRCLSTT